MMRELLRRQAMPGLFTLKQVQERVAEIANTRSKTSTR
jgi:hypothetical protein